MINDTQQTLINIKGKYIKRVLTHIELAGLQSLTIRKIVLDGFNDMMRDILKELGYDKTTVEK